MELVTRSNAGKTSMLNNPEGKLQRKRNGREIRGGKLLNVYLDKLPDYLPINRFFNRTSVDSSMQDSIDGINPKQFFTSETAMKVSSSFYDITFKTRSHHTAKLEN